MPRPLNASATFRPLGFNAAAIRSGKLIGAAPQGTLVNGKWTGVERYFHIEGSGFSRVSETDMAASGGMFYMNKAAYLLRARGARPTDATDNKGSRVK